MQDTRATHTRKRPAHAIGFARSSHDDCCRAGWRGFDAEVRRRGTWDRRRRGRRVPHGAWSSELVDPHNGNSGRCILCVKPGFDPAGAAFGTNRVGLGSRGSSSLGTCRSRHSVKACRCGRARRCNQACWPWRRSRQARAVAALIFGIACRTFISATGRKRLGGRPASRREPYAVRAANEHLGLNPGRRRAFS